MHLSYFGADLEFNGVVSLTCRLSGSPVVSYAEVRKKGEGKEKSADRKAARAGTGGYQPEIYTEEDEKLLGCAKSEWRLFVDGYDSKGTRIYDPVRGKTCHQCRYLALLHRILISFLLIWQFHSIIKSHWISVHVVFWQAKDYGASYFMQQLPVASWSILRRLSLHEVCCLEHILMV